MTTESPIRKLYKRCKRGRHAECPGSHAAYSVCECTCHVMDGAAAIEAAQAIVTAPVAPKPKRTKRVTNATRDTVTARHKADYTLRGVKGLHGYGFFDPCDEHATEENAMIIAFGRSETGARRQIAASAIGRLLRGCGECKERTRLALSTWARTQGDVPTSEAHKYPTRYKRTRMSRETFIAKYDVIGGVHFGGTVEKGNVQTAAINRCANRECRAMHNGLVVLHDTEELCGSCLYAGVKPRKRRAA